MSEQEKATISRTLQNFDKMGDFQKGFMVGYAERIADDRIFEEKNEPTAETEKEE